MVFLWALLTDANNLNFKVTSSANLYINFTMTYAYLLFMTVLRESFFGFATGQTKDTY